MKHDDEVRQTSRHTMALWLPIRLLILKYPEKQLLVFFQRDQGNIAHYSINAIPPLKKYHLLQYIK